jgi:pyruvate/2-oxoglutarate dehydrogenase complex dihydrolipoamide acyltransferase (E2) component
MGFLKRKNRKSKKNKGWRMMGEKRVRLNAMRRYIGKALQHSVVTYPQASGFFQADSTELLALKTELSSRGIHTSFTAFIVKAVVIALKDMPLLNSRIEGDEMIVYDEINPAIAIADEKGLYVPVIRGAQSKSTAEISEELSILVKKVKENKITPDDMAGGTITISSAGTGRTEFFTSIVSGDQCLIIGVGRTKKQPVVLADGSIAAREMTWMVTNMNHLLTDGRPVSLFRDRLVEIWENPRQYLAP